MNHWCPSRLRVLSLRTIHNLLTRGGTIRKQSWVNCSMHKRMVLQVYSYITHSILCPSRFRVLRTIHNPLYFMRKINPDPMARDAKTYKRVNNICVKKSSISGKNLCKILCCLVEKVSNVAISRFLWHFLANIITFFLHFFCFFWAIYNVLSWIWFVVIYSLFWVKYFCLKLCLCKKKVSFCMSAYGRYWQLQHLWKDHTQTNMATLWPTWPRWPSQWKL